MNSCHGGPNDSATFLEKLSALQPKVPDEISVPIGRYDVCHGRSTPYIGDWRPPTFNDGNLYNGAL